MKHNGISSFLLTTIIVISIFGHLEFPEVEGKDGSFGGGDGSSTNPYIIEDVGDLQNISSNLSAHYVLKNDINASITRIWNSGAGFEPIGTHSIFYNHSESFTGSLDGRNYTITGLYINRTIDDYIGLFGATGIGGEIRNLKLIDLNISGRRYVGGLVGINFYGNISYCFANGSATGVFSVGGLTSSNTGIITNSSSNVWAYGEEYVGGLVGYNHRNITGSFSIGYSNGYGSHTGGFVGYNRGLLSECFSSSKVSGHFSVGGFVGTNNEGTIYRCYSSGDVNGDQGIGGLIGSNNFGIVMNSFYNVDNVSINGKKQVTVFGIYNGQYSDWEGNNHTLNISDYNSTLIFYNGYYNISSVDGLKNLLGFSNIRNFKFRLSSNIDLSNTSGFFIPSFSAAEFDGSNHTISNVSIDQPNSNLGLIGFNDEGLVKNIGVVNCTINGTSYIGGLVGNNYGIVNNSYVSGGKLNGTGRFSYTGGLSGVNYGYFNNSHAIADVKGDGDRVGGFIGSNYGSVNNSFAGGTVLGYDGVGGFIGTNEIFGDVKKCYSTSTTGGRVSVGGFIGYNYQSSSSSCYSSGDVVGEYRVGGFLGSSNDGSIDNGYSDGNVSGNGRYFGGFIGYLYSGSISRCYAIGTVTGSSTVGGFSGYNDDGTISNCFWDTQTSGLSKSDGGKGKTTAEMKKYKTFSDAGWNFTNVWFMIENLTYPHLRWQDSESPIANAGPDQIVNEGDIVFFDGRQSSDNYGIINHTWTFTDGINITLYGPQPSFQFNYLGTFEVTLNVTDAVDNWGTDTMNIVVLDVTPPVADAGSDIIINESDTVTFNGSGSSDNVGITNYTWTFNDGAPIILEGVHPIYRFDNPGIFEITLNVSDAARNYDLDMMNVTVIDITPPIADAGSDMVINEGTTVSFNGNGSYDNVRVVKYTWTFFDIVYRSLNGMRPNYRFNNPGTFTIILNVTDAAGNWNIDRINITVLDITSPLANAGPDQIVDEGSTLLFDGSGSSDNVEIQNYTWMFFDITSKSLYGISPGYQFNNPGNFLVTLNVTDAAGNWNSDSMLVTVIDIILPAADAGPDQIVDQGTLVMFNGSGSSDNVGIVDYIWTLENGSQEDIRNNISWSRFFEMPGLYKIILNVTDEAGNWDTDFMELIVNDITPPKAVAGEDQIIPVNSTILLNGSMSSDNVDIKYYSWIITYDNEERTFDGKIIPFTFNKGGLYEIVLRVIDQSGNPDEATITITVIDTGKIYGVVLDSEGNSVENAIINITSSDGKLHQMTTDINGSFSFEIPHGSFNWEISKGGYTTISGTGSVNAMDEIQVDLSDTPLKTISETESESRSEKDILPYIIGIIALILVLVVIILFFILRRQKKEIEPTTLRDDDRLDESEEKEDPIGEKEDLISETASDDIITEDTSLFEPVMDTTPQQSEEPLLDEIAQPEDILPQQTDFTQEEVTDLHPPSMEPITDELTTEEITDSQS